ncbi:efflux RND transporter periplasmic adaptor subunit [Dinghuibacter silviterrae]|uniref:HlyD family secretion protein n=1 Tax=Dinghuibacter silviterrae TaxID=1539049 RepID=A0A4V3GKT0_9BACT|nr:HlyD family efflux transporter periplasmic adaptor subunit [Dinghuibacter silviterrae]TDW96782.1 HlyD family secretion protein [Dinghuibacter silviterrae]
MRLRYIVMLTLGLGLAACKHAASDEEADANPADAVTPVTLTHPAVGRMDETVEVNAVSSFLLKYYVKANAGGYLVTVNAQLGKYVHKGEDLFILQTKEARSLGNTVTALDTSLHFVGTIHLKSPGDGYITQLTYHAGDYVQDGEQLAVISDETSFVFLLNLPYELKPYLSENRQLQLHLPDGTVIPGTLSEALPSVDPASQTQPYVIRVQTRQSLPENLIAKVTLVKQAKTGAVSLPKAAVLTDETQSQYWIMKMIDSATAVKVPVQKGLETTDRVEILSPSLKATDNVLLTGNYGLGDTAKVSVDTTANQ